MHTACISPWCFVGLRKVISENTGTCLSSTAVEKQCAYRMCLYGMSFYLVKMVSEHPMTVLSSTAAESEDLRGLLHLLRSPPFAFAFSMARRPLLLLHLMSTSWTFCPCACLQSFLGWAG
jgi:hypothetical protein